jgi:O-antigen ligase
MYDKAIKLILIFLILFTPIAFGSMELWAFSLMELGILLVIILGIVQGVILYIAKQPTSPNNPNGYNVLNVSIILLSLFLLLVLFQMLPLPSGILKWISPKTYQLRFELSALSFPPETQPLALNFPLSFIPFLTQIEFFKWVTLAALFFFLLNWRLSNQSILNLVPVMMLVGIAESLYGMFEFFSGHKQILHLEGFVSSVTGTFINRNYFAGYLLMVIPISLGFLFSREVTRTDRWMGWRNRFSSLNGKTLLIGFGVIVMILGLLFSASRMGIVSLLISFSLITLLFRGSQGEKRFSRSSIFILGLALLWAAWIGLDAVISRFFSVSEDFEGRWKIWANTFQIFKDFPLFGSGLGTFVQLFPMYRSFHIRGLVTHAENDFLQLISEVGILGTGLLAILFFFLLFKAFSRTRSLSYREPGRYIAMGGLVGILALMFHSMVERNIQVPANAFLYTLIFAIVLRIAPIRKEEKRS